MLSFFPITISNGTLQLYYSRLLIHELEFIFIEKCVSIVSDDYCTHFMLKLQVLLVAISIGAMCNFRY
jgi:hypothetical protein